MNCKSILPLGALALGLALGGPARSAVMTADIQITGAGPYNIAYYLAQQPTTMQVKIFTQSGTLIRTIDVTDPNATTPGKHDATNGVAWDGKTDGGTDATPGVYYAQIDTTGDPVFTATNLPLLNAGVESRSFAPQNPQVSGAEARTVYGGAVNRDVTSPFHNLAYFGVGRTNDNSNSSSGLEVVRPDATSTIFGLNGAPSTYDYVSASLFGDGTVLLGTNAREAAINNASSKELLAINPLDGSVLNRYQSGKIVVRTMQAFGSPPAGRVYFIDRSLGGVQLLSPLTAETWTTIIPDNAFPPRPQYGLVVNRTETSLWVSGHSSNISYIVKFKKVTGGSPEWQQDTAFVPVDPEGNPLDSNSLAPTGNIRGLALSPDETTLWVTNNQSDGTLDRIYALDANSGAFKGAEWLLDFTPAALTPQTIAASAGDANHNGSTSYNLFVTGFRNFPGAVTTANGVTVVAPPDNGSSDTTRSQLFEVVGNATAVTVTSGPTVTNITDTSATVTWTTDFRSDSTVHLGTAPGVYTEPDRTKSVMETSHSVVLNDLAPGTTYHFQVESKKDPLTPGTKTGQFTTTPNLVITSESLVATATSATLTFDTNVASAATVTWGEAPDALTQPAINVASGTSHTATFNGLTAGKTYYYQIALTSASANPFTSIVSAFATAATGGTNATQTFSSFNLAHKVGVVNNGAAIELPRQGVPTFPTAVPSLPEPTFFAGAAAYNGYLYLVGGTNSVGSALPNVYYAKILADGTLDPTFGGGFGWQPAANILPAARTEIANSVFAYNGYLYVVGGSDGTATQATVLYAPLNPTTGDVGAWKGLEPDGTTPTNPIPATFTRGGARAVDGNVIVSGGAQAGVVVNVDYVARIRPDGSLGPWQTTAPLFRATWDQSLLGNAHTLYSIGGESGAKLSSVDVATVQPNGDLTKTLPANNYPGHANSVMPNVTSAAAAGIAGGKIITAGGSFNEIQSGNVQGTQNILYAKILDDKLPGPWVNAGADDPTAILPQNSANLTAAVYNNALYVLGGRGIVTYFGGGGTPAETAVADANVFILNPDPNDTGYAAYGTLESQIADLGSLTNLQHLKVAGANVSASTVSVRYRFANADGVFTDWYDLSGVDADITGGARYFQYQVVLKGSATVTPSITSVELKTGAAITPPDKFARVRTALKIAGGLQAASPAEKADLDVDGNGKVEVLDAVRLDRQLNGK